MIQQRGSSHSYWKRDFAKTVPVPDRETPKSKRSNVAFIISIKNAFGCNTMRRILLSDAEASHFRLWWWYKYRISPWRRIRDCFDTRRRHSEVLPDGILGVLKIFGFPNIFDCFQETSLLTYYLGKFRHDHLDDWLSNGKFKTHFASKLCVLYS